jgi:hypothetical protein
MANALTLRFGSDTAGAQRGVTSLAQSIASSMTQVSGTALLAGRNVMSFAPPRSTCSRTSSALPR